MTRKEEIQEELKEIRTKEIEQQLKEEDDLGKSAEAVKKAKDANSHRFVMKGDFILKFVIALVISTAFIYTVVTGVDSGAGKIIRDSSHFEIISVLGPLFGMVLQYYFGKNKAGANGE